MVRTIPRSHAVHLPFRRSDDSLRHLPLQTDGELKHQQRCNYPFCGSVTHDPQPTLPAVMREEAHHRRKFA
jgi:hypothetical protein